jgi:hypothetical protein
MKRLDILFIVALLFMVWNFFRKTPEGSQGKGATTNEEKQPINAENAMGSLDRELDAFTRDIEETMGVTEPVKGIQIPDEFYPQDLDRIGTVEKLKEDLSYRKEKFERYLNHEKIEYEKSHDVKGKDKEAYKILWAQHNQSRKDLSIKHSDILKSFEKRIKEESSSQLR